MLKPTFSSPTETDGNVGFGMGQETENDID
jgi:hypothetical protein